MLTSTRAGTARPTLTLAVIVTCQLMIILDATVMTVALPDIQADLGFSPAGLSWVQNAYLLSFGGLLLLGGRAGDILGRRRVYLAGVLIFTAASLVGGLATTPAMLLAARVAQGIGGALAAPGALALINTTFPAGPARVRAIGVYATAGSAGSAIGMILGGLLTGAASWHWALLINVPIGLVIAVLTPLLVPETGRRPGRFDLLGALTSTFGTTALVYAFVRAAQAGWHDSLTIAAFAAAAVLLAAFVATEAKTAEPIMPLRLFTDRTRAVAFADMMLLPAAMFGAFFFLTQFLQFQLAFSPLVAGFGLLPLPAAMLVIARLVPRLLTRFTQTTLIAAGLVLIIAADLWLTRLSGTTGYLTGLFGPILLLGIGVGLTFVPLNMMVLHDVGPEDSGAASGVMQALQQAGAAVGLAVLVTVSADGLDSAFLASTVFAGCALAIALLFLRRSGSRPESTDRGGAGPIA